MGKSKAAVFDAGPFIHLHEIQQLRLLRLFRHVLTTNEGFEECKGIAPLLAITRSISVREITAGSKDFTKYLMERYAIQLGEATAIALCKQESIRFFFTDDLEARGAARAVGFEPHGTLAIVLRAYRERLLSKAEAARAVAALYEESTLFFTRDLFEWTLQEIRRFRP